MKRKEIISEVGRFVSCDAIVRDDDRSMISKAAQLGAEKALDLAGFSDAIPQSSPRPLSVPPRMPGKNGEFGPTETRKAEE